MNKKKILCLDFSIFGYGYLGKLKESLHEFDYWLRDCPFNFSFDTELFNDVSSYLCSVAKVMNKDNIYFLYRQEDIIALLDKECDNTVYNIDFFPDTNDCTYLVRNDNWARYAIDKGLISEYRWIHCGNSESLNNIYAYKKIDNLDFSFFLDLDELIITLSPEYSKQEYHSLFYNILNTYNILLDTEYQVEEKLWDWLNYNKIESKNCYVTILSTNSYAPAVVSLNYSLIKSGSKIPLKVIVSNFLSKSALSLLSLYGIDYEMVEDLRKDIWEVNLDDLQLIDENAKINKISCKSLLKDYDKIMYLDADSIVTDNIDYLFDANPDTTFKELEIIDKNIFMLDKNQLFDLETTYLIHNKGKDKYWFNKPLKEVLNYIDIIYQIKEEKDHGKTG